MNKVIVTFDRSNEDIPTLIIARENIGFLTPGIDVIKIVTGRQAVDLWDRLTEKEGDK